jgi:hypothetical protein
MSSAGLSSTGIAPRRRSIVIPLPAAGAAALLATGVALTLVLAAFIATGGLQLKPTTTVLIGFMLIGGASCAVATWRAPRSRAHPLYGGLALLALAALAGFTAISIIWSLAPGDSWVEANRTIAYLALFAGAIALSRVFPSAWPGMLAGLAVACVVICVWALLTKVFPASLAGDETAARLRAPFDYWNSVGFTATFGIFPLLWLGARRHGHPAISALAVPAIALLLVCLLLSYSRGALIALGIGLAFWLAAVPLRIPGLVTLGLAALGAGPIIWWSFLQDGLTTDEAPMSARVDAGHELGALLATMCSVLLLASLAAQFARSRRAPSARVRRRVGAGLAALAVLVVLGSVLATALSPGGLEGQVSKAWNQLVDPKAALPANTPDRLKETSSVRARYFEEAFKVHQLSPWVGVGAGGYAVARSRFRQNAVQVRHAHGYVPQTLADLGWVGLALSVVALLGWLFAAGRATGLRWRDRGLPYDAERIGMLTLVAAVVAYGAHSAIDWTWFVPANTAAAAIAAGWVAGRVPLRRRLLEAEPEPPERGSFRLRGLPGALRARPAATGVVLLLAFAALATAWTALQPVRSVNASDAAFERLDAGAYEAAASIAERAVERNPLSVDALFDLATIEQARGQLPAAEAALRRAVRLEPGNAETWRRLGRFQLYDLQQPERALRHLRAALILDPVSMTSRSDVLIASREAQAPLPQP